jgi:hypothetical protein
MGPVPDTSLSVLSNIHPISRNADCIILKVAHLLFADLRVL